jgi:hypothetical protein
MWTKMLEYVLSKKVTASRHSLFLIIFVNQTKNKLFIKKVNCSFPDMFLPFYYKVMTFTTICSKK